jgi:hypothetical protein
VEGRGHSMATMVPMTMQGRREGGGSFWRKSRMCKWRSVGTQPENGQVGVVAQVECGGGSWADAGGGTCRARSGVTVCDSARPAQLWAERA